MATRHAKIVHLGDAPYPGSVAPCSRWKGWHPPGDSGGGPISEQENRGALERYRQVWFESRDIDAASDLLHDDHIEEYPQSGERIRGKDNARGVYDNYPSIPSLVDYGYRLNGDLAVVEMVLDCDGNHMNVCEVVEFEDGKIKRATGYFGEPFESPEWRARWVEGA
jgi:hypothetical protein